MELINFFWTVFVIFFSEPIAVQIYNYTETSPLICKVNQWNGFSIKVSLDWHSLVWVKIFYSFFRLLIFWGIFWSFKVGYFIQSFQNDTSCLGILWQRGDSRKRGHWFWNRGLRCLCTLVLNLKKIHAESVYIIVFLVTKTGS